MWSEFVFFSVGSGDLSSFTNKNFVTVPDYRSLTEGCNQRRRGEKEQF